MISIMGAYHKTPTAPAEELDTARTWEEANELVGEYRLAFGANWSIYAEDKSKKKK